MDCWICSRLVVIVIRCHEASTVVVVVVVRGECVCVCVRAWCARGRGFEIRTIFSLGTFSFGVSLPPGGPSKGVPLLVLPLEPVSIPRSRYLGTYLGKVNMTFTRRDTVTQPSFH